MFKDLESNKRQISRVSFHFKRQAQVAQTPQSKQSLGSAAPAIQSASDEGEGSLLLPWPLPTPPTLALRSGQAATAGGSRPGGRFRK